MLTLKFNKSKSKKLDSVLKNAILFSGYIDNGNSINISLPVKEVFEKREFFNEIFWNVVDWKETIFIFENTEHYSHSDKTRIFYALQNAHWKWMSYVENRIATIYNTTEEELKLENLDTSSIDDQTADLLIDLHLIKTNIK